jgi:thiamine-phosphate pyrophosphorylase
MSAPRAVGRLHVLTDRFDLACAAAEGGADTVQFRDKRAGDHRALAEIALCMRAWLHERRVALIVNDRVELAAEIGADGVHLGAADTPVRLARQRLGAAAIIGRTANTHAEALCAAREPADYLGVGPVFRTASKDNPARPLGLDGLARIAAAVDLPVVAIGGIDAARVRAVLAAGAWGVAVLSAVAAAADPLGEIARMREAIEGARARVG